MAKYAKAFGMKVFYHDPFKKNKKFKKVNLRELIEKSDVISIHTHVNNQTKYLINKKNLKVTKKKPIIINTSRGSVVNENDLIDAYNQNLISGFALDVFENEPITKDLYERITSEMNCILTPHISGVTTESNTRVSNFIVKKTIDFFK